MRVKASADVRKRSLVISIFFFFAMALALVIVPVVPAIIIPVPVLALFMVPVRAITVTLLIARNVFALIPVVLNKIDAFATGVVLVTMLAPIFGMTGRNAQIDRRALDHYPLDHHWLTIDELRRRIITDVDLAIESGMTDAQRNSNIRGSYRSANDHQ